VDLMSFVKDEARKIVDNLPENASWEDLMYQLYVKKRIEAALQEIENGETISHEEVKKKLLS
jgi:predicted transcriptional regulator